MKTTAFEFPEGVERGVTLFDTGTTTTAATRNPPRARDQAVGKRDGLVLSSKSVHARRLWPYYKDFSPSRSRELQLSWNEPAWII
jgi:hypothetical protein